MKTITAMLIALAMQVVLSSAVDYCQVKSCGNRQTACLYSKSGPGPHCGEYQSSGVSDDEKHRIVNIHNTLRQRVASGQETRGSPGPQPRAKSMPDLEWDDELAFVAQRWSDQCTWGNDDCRDVDRFGVGQNIGIVGSSGALNVSAEGLVELWYNEVKFFSKDEVSRFTNQGEGGKEIAHYTQMVWAKSTKIGCGITKYKENDNNKYYLVCNYGPTGNCLGEPLYEIA